MRLKITGPISQALIIMIPALFMGACDQPEKSLQLADLTSDEHTYVERFVVLERAKAIALDDRDLGDTVLDSLSIAWGDSVEKETAAMAPAKPLRSVAVHDLLKRIILAERDSLIHAPTVQRLSAPLPDPHPEPAPPKNPSS